MTRTLVAPRVQRLRYEPAPGTRALRPARHRVVRPPDPVPLAVPDERAVRRAVGVTLRVAIEALDGRRTFDQLAAHLTPGPMGYWRAETARRRSGGSSRVLRLRIFLPHPGAAEVAAVCRVDGQVRALAARFECCEARWQCTVLRLL